MHYAANQFDKFIKSQNIECEPKHKERCLYLKVSGNINDTLLSFF